MITVAVLVQLIPSSGQVSSANAAAQRQIDVEVLGPRAQAQGRLRVLVSLDIPVQPEGRLRGLAQAQQQRALIADAQRALTRQLDPSHSQLLRRFKFVPVIALRVDEAGLAELAANPLVIHVQEDVPVPPILEDSVPLIRADQAWALGFEGAGHIVAILDTGVDSDHEFLTDKVIGEACFSTTDVIDGAASACPNGEETQTGAGAGFVHPVLRPGWGIRSLERDQHGRAACGRGLGGAQVQERRGQRGRGLGRLHLHWRVD